MTTPSQPESMSILGDTRTVLESMGDAYYALDSGWRIVYANKRALDFWGATADDVLGHVIWDRFPQLVGTLNERVLRQARDEQRAVHFEAPSPVTGVQVSATVGPASDGVCVFWRDITDRVLAEQALRRSEEHLRLAQEAGGIGTWEWDLKTDKMVWSAQMFRVLGREPVDTPDLKALLLECVHPDDRNTAETSLVEFRAQPGPLRMEVRVLWPNGVTRWIVFLGRVIVDAVGKPARMLGITIDGTSRRRGEDAIREDAELLRLAMKARGLATWEFNLETQVRQWSAEAALMHGFPADKTAMTRTEWREMIHPDDLPMVRDEFSNLLAGKSDYSVEYRIVRPDGEIRWTGVHGALLRSSDGQPSRVIGVLQDITDRKQSEAQLRDSEARLRELVDTIHLASVFVRELDGRIRFWSRGCERLYGWTEAEAVGHSSHQLLKVEFPIPLPEIETILRNQNEWQGDVLHRRRDGSVLTVSVHKVLGRDADGQPAVVLENVADVTVLRRMETELRVLNQELEARVRAEVAAREAAQTRAAHAERIQALGELAGGIAHDFNNVLQSIQGGAALMTKRASDPGAVKRFSEMILDAAARGASITRRLLAFARRSDLRAEAVAVAELLENLREVLAPTLGAGIQIRVEAASDLPPLLADKGQLETAIVNLAVNARDAMPSGGTLILSASAETDLSDQTQVKAAGLSQGNYIRLVVADTGEGMDAATLARVVEPFFTTKAPGKGTGLGLPMVKGFAEQSGGALQIESERGRGTSVILWLPQAEFAVSADAVLREVDGTSGGSRLRLLLVDDDALVRESLAVQLEELLFDVLVADSGSEALALIAAGERIDAIITDLSMPTMDGVALIRAAQAQRPGLPAVLLTGYAGDGATLAMSGVISGSYTLLRKPVRAEQLADRIAALLETKGVP